MTPPVLCTRGWSQSYGSVECLSVVFVSRKSVFMFRDSCHMRLYHSSAVIRRRGVREVLHFLLIEAPGSCECSHVLAITFSEVEVPLAMDKVEPHFPWHSLMFFCSCQCRSHMRRLPPFADCCRSSSLPSVYVTCRRWSRRSGTWFMLPRCALSPSPFWAGFSRCSGGPGRASPDSLMLLPEPIWLGGIPSSPTGRVSPHQFLVLGEPDGHLFTDASVSWGCGAWMLPVWLQVPWPADHCLS